MCFLSKPFDGQVMIDCLTTALAREGRVTGQNCGQSPANRHRPKYKSPQPIRLSQEPLYNGARGARLSIFYVSRQRMDEPSPKVKTHADERTVQDHTAV